MTDKKYITLINDQDIALARRCLEMSLEQGADKARLTLNKSCMDLIASFNGEVDKVSHCMDRSISLSVFAFGRFGSFSTNNLDEASLARFVKKAVETASYMANDPCRDLPSPERTAKDAQEGTELQLLDDSYFDLTPEDRLKTALDASIFKSINADAEWTLLSEEAEYSDSIYDTLVIDTQGLYCRHTETSFEYGVEMTVQDREERRYSAYWWEAEPFLNRLDIKDCCSTALKRACNQLNPKPHRSGSFRCVVESECASKLVTPLLNALNGYSIQQNNSFLCDSIGKQLFSPGLTIREECRSIAVTGSRLFDSEGVATSTHNIIEQGTVKEYFINTYISNKTGMPPTIEDATRPHLLPWPQAGLDRDAIMKQCRNGILITGFNGGNSNSATGDFSFGIEGYAFKDGKITHPVHEMLITGNLISLWNRLIAVGDDARCCMSKLVPTIAFDKVDFSG